MQSQNRQLQKEVLEKARPHLPPDTVLTLQEYDALQTVIEEHNAQLLGLRSMFEARHDTDIHNLISVTQECFSDIQSLRDKAQQLREELVADTNVEIHSVLQEQMQQVAACDVAVGMAGLWLQWHSEEGRRPLGAYDFASLKKGFDEEMEAMLTQRQWMEDLQALHFNPGKAAGDLRNRLLGVSVKQMALKWGAGQCLKRDLNKFVRNPAALLLLKPILQQEKFQGEAQVTKHVQQLKALVVLMEGQDDGDQDIMQAIVGLQSVHRSNRNTLTAECALLASLKEGADAGPVLEELASLFEEEVALTSRWLGIAAETLRMAGKDEVEGDPVTEDMVHAAWEEHEQKLSEVQIESQCLLRDILHGAASVDKPAAQEDATGTTATSPGAVPDPSGNADPQPDIAHAAGVHPEPATNLDKGGASDANPDVEQTLDSNPALQSVPCPVPEPSPCSDLSPPIHSTPHPEPEPQPDQEPTSGPGCSVSADADAEVQCEKTQQSGCILC